MRPLYEYDHTRIRGLPEWFLHYVEEAYSKPFSVSGSHERRAPSRNSSGASERDRPNPRHQHSRSFSATVFSSAGSTSVAPSNRKVSLATGSILERSPTRVASPRESDLWGVDKFCFVQPKDRSKPAEWWKAGDFSEKSLRVTQLQVSESFPACVARQKVVNRRVYLQSPLEAGIDAVCQWCAVLFRTAIATNGMDVLKTNFDHGIGTEASKVVADCIHNSHVKEIGMSLLQVRTEPTGDDDYDDNNRLTEDEIQVLQLRLARLLITFVQLLHLLVSRNRELLLTVIKKRKGAEAATSATSSNRGFARTSSTGQRDRKQAGGGSVDLNGSRHQRRRSEGFGSDGARYRGGQHSQMGSEDNQSYHSMLTTSEARADSAIAVQSELQRAFIKLSKALHRNIHDIMLDETPEWFKQCCADNYFSLNKYRDNKMPIEEEVCFNDYNGLVMQREAPAPSIYSEAGYESPRSRGGSIGGGSHCGSSVMSRTSDRHHMF